MLEICRKVGQKERSKPEPFFRVRKGIVKLKLVL